MHSESKVQSKINEHKEFSPCEGFSTKREKGENEKESSFRQSEP